MKRSFPLSRRGEQAVDRRPALILALVVLEAPLDHSHPLLDHRYRDLALLEGLQSLGQVGATLVGEPAHDLRALLQVVRLEPLAKPEHPGVHRHEASSAQRAKPSFEAPE